MSLLILVLDTLLTEFMYLVKEKSSTQNLMFCYLHKN